ncbi:MAG TPA: NAD(P)H-hydrate epimerase, partial [Candidatus Binatus sp.]|nr:NAD(P)H-hydrate epimerase [Candidatus Binatus sp.]
MTTREETVTHGMMVMAELNSEYLGVNQMQLMECAGYGTANQIIQRIIRQKLDRKVTIVSGPGRNGGDGFATARHLSTQGCQVRVILIGRETDVHDNSAKHQLASIKAMDDTIQFESIPDSAMLKPFKAGVIVDAILGTGLKGELRQPLLGAVRMINKSEGFKVAVDLPSGLDSDTGEPHTDAVKANLTICLHKKKQGLAITKANDYVGELMILPVGIPEEAETYAGPGDYKILWKP